MSAFTLRPGAGVGMVLLVSAACAPAPIRISDSEVARLKAEPEIRVVRYESATVEVTTRGGDIARQFGLIGLAAGTSVDQNIKSKVVESRPAGTLTRRPRGT